MCLARFAFLGLTNGILAILSSSNPTFVQKNIKINSIIIVKCLFVTDL